MAHIEIVGTGICPIYIVEREVPYEFSEVVDIFMSEAEALDCIRNCSSIYENYYIYEYCLLTHKKCVMYYKNGDNSEKYEGTICREDSK